jgi:hypothetical protein
LTGVSRRELLPLGLLLAVTRARPAFLTYDQVAPILESCKLALPPEPAWPNWIRAHDAAIRARLRRGEEDSLVNFVLFGVSFTDQPRGQAVDSRVRDFIQALRRPGNNERLLLLKQMLAGKGTEVWIEGAVSRYLAEQGRYRALFDSAPANDPAFSELYKNRGLSLDTNFRPNRAIEQTLTDLKQRGALTFVRRAAIIGPGLDFTDKDYGFDYYPLQTLQPFGLADSLIRLGLAGSSDLQISVFDISAQTLDHVSRAVRRARAGQPYTVQLVLDEARAWSPDVLEYWRRFGDTIGTPAKAVPAPAQVRNVMRRAVAIRPEIVKLLEPRPLNLVTQSPGIPANERYDLVIATNVLVYYDAFDRALCSLNIQAMMSEGGVFLSNTPLPECPALNLRPIGKVDVQYSAESGDDDRIEIYSNARFGRALAPL